jgi:hypothetical protein
VPAQRLTRQSIPDQTVQSSNPLRMSVTPAAR